MECNGSSLRTRVLALHVRPPLRIRRIVSSSFSRALLQFVPHRAFHDAETLCNLSQRISLPAQYLDLISIAPRQMPSFFLFSSTHNIGNRSNSKDNLPFGLAPDEGENVEEPSEQIFGGFSHDCKDRFVQKAYFVYKPLRIDKTHLRQKRRRLFTFNDTN